jgi:hypothetical protein
VSIARGVITSSFTRSEFIVKVSISFGLKDERIPTNENWKNIGTNFMTRETGKE